MEQVEFPLSSALGCFVSYFYPLVRLQNIYDRGENNFDSNAFQSGALYYSFLSFLCVHRQFWEIVKWDIITGKKKTQMERNGSGGIPGNQMRDVCWSVHALREWFFRYWPCHPRRRWWAWIHQRNAKTVSVCFVSRPFVASPAAAAVWLLPTELKVRAIYSRIVAGETLGGYRHLIPVQCPHLLAQSSRKKRRARGLCFFRMGGGRCWTLGFDGGWTHCNVPGKRNKNSS